MRTAIVSVFLLGLLVNASVSSARAQHRVLRFDSDRETLVSVQVGSHMSSYTYIRDGYSYRALGREADFQHLCFTPCRARLPSRVLQLRVERQGVGQLWLDPIDPPDGSTVRVHVHHRGGERTAGFTIFLLGWPLAGALALAVPLGNGWAEGVATREMQLFDDAWEQALWISSGASLLLSWIVGSSLGFARDSADVEIIPNGIRF
jgi:hypothetical protein